MDERAGKDRHLNLWRGTISSVFNSIDGPLTIALRVQVLAILSLPFSSMDVLHALIETLQASTEIHPVLLTK